MFSIISGLWNRGCASIFGADYRVEEPKEVRNDSVLDELKDLRKCG